MYSNWVLKKHQTFLCGGISGKCFDYILTIGDSHILQNREINLCKND